MQCSSKYAYGENWRPQRSPPSSMAAMRRPGLAGRPGAPGKPSFSQQRSQRGTLGPVGASAAAPRAAAAAMARGSFSGLDRLMVISSSP